MHAQSKGLETCLFTHYITAEQWKDPKGFFSEQISWLQGTSNFNIIHYFRMLIISKMLRFIEKYILSALIKHTKIR